MYNSMMIQETKKAGFLPRVWVECLIFLLLFFISQILQGAILMVPTFLEIMKNPDPSMVQDLINTPSIMVISLFSTATVIAVILVYCLLIQKRSLASLGLIKKGIAKNYLYGCLAGIGFSVAVYALLFVFGCIDSFHVNGFYSSVALLFFAFIIQSASEELMMRGYLMNSIAAKSGIPLAVILNSVLFMALHLLNPGVTFIAMLNIFIYGVVFSLLCLVTDNIWMVCGMHFSWNFALGCIYGGNVSGLVTDSLFTVTLKGSDLLTGSEFGIEGSILTTVVGLVIILILGVLYGKKNQEQALE